MDAAARHEPGLVRVGSDRNMGHQHVNDATRLFGANQRARDHVLRRADSPFHRQPELKIVLMRCSIGRIFGGENAFTSVNANRGAPCQD